MTWAPFVDEANVPRLPLVQPEEDLDAPQAPDPAWFVVTLPCFLKLFYLGLGSQGV